GGSVSVVRSLPRPSPISTPCPCPTLFRSLDHDVVDVEDPREIPSLVRTSKRVAHDVAAYREARRDGISEMLDRLHISHLLTQGESTVVEDMIALLRSREYRHARA